VYVFHEIGNFPNLPNSIEWSNLNLFFQYIKSLRDSKKIKVVRNIDAFNLFSNPKPTTTGVIRTTTTTPTPITPTTTPTPISPTSITPTNPTQLYTTIQPTESTQPTPFIPSTQPTEPTQPTTIQPSTPTTLSPTTGNNETTGSSSTSTNTGYIYACVFVPLAILMLVGGLIYWKKKKSIHAFLGKKENVENDDIEKQWDSKNIALDSIAQKQ
jgi:hypothetical protein